MFRFGTDVNTPQKIIFGAKYTVWKYSIGMDYPLTAAELKRHRIDKRWNSILVPENFTVPTCG